jgi:outer membrane immunogenic protein
MQLYAGTTRKPVHGSLTGTPKEVKKHLEMGVQMNRAKLAMLASTSLCLSCGFSYAADLPLKAPVAPVAAVDPWVGWYAGGNLGYSWGKTDTDTSVKPFTQENFQDNFFTFPFPGGASSTSSKVNGVIGGGQVGYVGRIAPHWLGGIEADIQGSGQRGSAHGGFAGNTNLCTSEFCSFTSAHDLTSKLGWFGTFRGRAGFESNGLWIYGTGGLAFGEVSVSGNNSLALISNAGEGLVGSYSTPFSYSQFKAGWTAGVGIEGLVGNGPWRWKVEYLHIDLGSINGGAFGGASPANTLPSILVNTTRFTDDILRVGFNYKFDSDRPVVADMPVKARALPSAAPSWTGWYAGVNAGYIDSLGRTSTNAVILATDTSPANEDPNAGNIANTATNQFNNRSSGFLGGAQAGYNYQFSRSFVAGLETDIQGSTLRQNLNVTSTEGQVGGPFWVTTTTVSNRLDYLGTVRGRIGVTPISNLLLYSTGGLAYGGVSSSTQINFNNTGGAVPGSSSGSFSDTRFGWTAGGGLEWMFSPNWTARLEYLYYDLGSAKYATGGYSVDLGLTNFPDRGIQSVGTSTTTHFNGNIVRVGVNYKFGGGS